MEWQPNTSCTTNVIKLNTLNARVVLPHVRAIQPDSGLSSPLNNRTGLNSNNGCIYIQNTHQHSATIDCSKLEKSERNLKQREYSQTRTLMYPRIHFFGWWPSFVTAEVLNRRNRWLQFPVARCQLSSVESLAPATRNYLNNLWCV